MTSFLAIVGAKGGVGKTTTSILLTHAFGYFNRHVVLLDLHLHKPNVGVYLQTKSDKNIHTALAKKHHILETIQSVQIDAAVGSSDDTLVHREFETKDIEYILSELVHQTEIVLIDTPSGLSKEAKTVYAVCDNVIVLTTADEISIHDANRTIAYLQKIGKRIVGVVVNKFSGKVTDLQSQLSAPIIGVIPEFKTIDVIAPTDSILVHYKKLAANLLGEHFEQQSDDNFFRYVAERLGFKKPQI